MHWREYCSVLRAMDDDTCHDWDQVRALQEVKHASTKRQAWDACSVRPPRNNPGLERMSYGSKLRFSRFKFSDYVFPNTWIYLTLLDCIHNYPDGEVHALCSLLENEIILHPKTLIPIAPKTQRLLQRIETLGLYLCAQMYHHLFYVNVHLP